MQRTSALWCLFSNDLATIAINATVQRTETYFYRYKINLFAPIRRAICNVDGFVEETAYRISTNIHGGVAAMVPMTFLRERTVKSCENNLYGMSPRTLQPRPPSLTSSSNIISQNNAPPEAMF